MKKIRYLKIINKSWDIKSTKIINLKQVSSRKFKIKICNIRQENNENPFFFIQQNQSLKKKKKKKNCI